MADFTTALGLIIKFMFIKIFMIFFFFRWQGSDPRKNASINPNYSVRGKLQTRRCKLNKEINKELRLRAGAENLYKVSRNELHIFVWNDLINDIVSFLLATKVKMIKMCDIIGSVREVNVWFLFWINLRVINIEIVVVQRCEFFRLRRSKNRKRRSRRTISHVDCRLHIIYTNQINQAYRMSREVLIRFPSSSSNPLNLKTISRSAADAIVALAEFFNNSYKLSKQQIIYITGKKEKENGEETLKLVDERDKKSPLSLLRDKFFVCCSSLCCRLKSHNKRKLYSILTKARWTKENAIRFLCYIAQTHEKQHIRPRKHTTPHNTQLAEC